MHTLPSAPPDQDSAQPGYYADPTNPAALRYWDGSTWTQQVLPAGGATASSPVSNGLVIAGYVFAVLIPIVGIVLGLIAVHRHGGRGTNHGIWIIVTALVIVVLTVVALTSGSSA